MEIITQGNYELHKRSMEYSVFVSSPRTEDYGSRIASSFEYVPDLCILNAQSAESNTGDSIRWRIHHQELASFLTYIFVPGDECTQQLLELGTYGTSDAKNCLVFCDPAYPHYLQVCAFCEHFNVSVSESWDSFLDKLTLRIHEEIFY